MRYAITYKDEGILRPVFRFATQAEAAKAWFARHHGNTSSLDFVIENEDGQNFEAGFDGGFFLNKI